LASLLSCPIGLKNGTDGNLQIALDAVAAASQPHHFPAVTKDGRAAIASTTGNDDCNIVLRAARTPNYAAKSVDATSMEAARRGVQPNVMIDSSQAHRGKNPDN